MPVITLTTDFGVSDHFVGAMKGVILTLAPRATIVDITHQIAPQNVAEAAFVIAQAWHWFPKKTIHVIVVDPGVGSSRRPILCEVAGHFFIAPDNGVLSMLYRAAAPKVRVIANPKLMAKRISQTFHGRDVFAPAAAHLAKGVSPARFGPLITDYVRLSAPEPVEISPETWNGVILKVDHFGNLITNFSVDNFAALETGRFELRIAGHRIRKLAHSYSECAVGEVFAIAASAGYLEIAANQASAAKILGCGAGAQVQLETFRR